MQQTPRTDIAEDLHDHDRGLAHDLSTLVHRRRALRLLGLGGAGVLALAACGSSKSTSSATTTGAATTSTTGATTTAASSTAASTSVSAATTAAGTASNGSSTDVSTAINEETAGPYPGDGSNGKNVLNQSGIVRADIRSSFGTSTTTAAGIPFAIKLRIVEVGSGDPLAGAAVYVWHCDRDGNYSMYSQATIGENYLRGVQETDADGNVSFTSIFPACYSGRWPHVHYEVYPSVASATAASSKLATSQLALPEATCKLVYATTGYSASVTNLSQVTLATDNVFSDGASRETPTITGDITAGLVSSLVVPVKA